MYRRCIGIFNITGSSCHSLKNGTRRWETKTLDQIGKIFKLTREGIRQIEERALRKLRHPSRSQKLRNFLK
ncbi:sigma factor-like helix-turn-helix DNA-binding protein [Priestia filamentosa]|uniref:sigma factor-like helix-turn-helix DNA-binding protein n=1 Tax=Priestia filamentosa TaxID=1402861 RepID=UPI003982CD59